MDAFGWSTQPPTAPSCPSDDDLLAAFLGANSFELHSDGAVSSDAYGGLDLPSSHDDLSLMRCQQDGVTLPGDASNAFQDSMGLLPAIAAAAHDGLLLDRFAFPNVHDEPALADGSTAAFSGYSTTTGGGNISSGESNTYGGHDTEVASPCAVSQRVLPQMTLPLSERKLLDEYKAVAASATTTEEVDRRWGTKRAAETTGTTTSITFGQSGGQAARYEPDTEAIAQVKQMIYRAAAMRPVDLGAAAGEPPKPRRRKNVRISSDPQTVAARLRRERVSERLHALQRLVPGGSKMDTASMLDEAASYLRFLKSQLEALETLGSGSNGNNGRSLQRYMGRNPSRASNGTVLAFGTDGITGNVKSNRNMQL